MTWPDKRYSIIYADPPWRYGNYSNRGNKRKAEISKFGITPYKTMSLQELKKLQVSEIAEKDSVLLMWVTFPCLEDGLKLVKKWGFSYKTVAFTWLKKYGNGIDWYLGLGNYSRANAEICLLATRGNGLKVKSHSVSQVCDAPITRHSEKPFEIRNRIVRLFGNVSRIELFARHNIPGWDSWGNEVPREYPTIELYTS